MMRVDFDKLRLILLPHVLRNGELLEVLFRTVYRPLKRNYADFRAYVIKEEQERQYGPTVKQLRQAICDHLGIDASLVRFADVDNKETLPLRRQSDAKSTHIKLGKNLLPLWSDDILWWNREFIISLPKHYNSPYIEAQVRTIIDRWKMAASNYTITYYETL